MINLSQLNREELMNYFASAHNQLLIAEDLTKEYNNLKSQIRSTIEQNDILKSQISESLAVAKKYANRTGHSYATDLDSFLNNAATTLGFAGGYSLFDNFKGIFGGLKNWLKDGCLTYIILGVIFFSIIPKILPNMSEKAFLTSLLSIMIFSLVIYPIIKALKRQKVAINKINQEILENNAYLEEEANKLDAEIEKEVEKWNNMFPEFPMQYAYTYATYYFYQALKTYRADNIKEVINSFEEYLYRERMIDAQNEIIQEQRANNIIAEQNLYVNLANLNELRNQTQVIQNESRNIRNTISNEANSTRSFLGSLLKK